MAQKNAYNDTENAQKTGEQETQRPRFRESKSHRERTNKTQRTSAITQE